MIAVSKGKARIQFFDNNVLEDVNVSMVESKKDSYIEICATSPSRNQSTKETVSRKGDCLTIRKVAGLSR